MTLLDSTRVGPCLFEAPCQTHIVIVTVCTCLEPCCPWRHVAPGDRRLLESCCPWKHVVPGIMLPLKTCCPWKHVALGDMLPLETCCTWRHDAPGVVLPLDTCCPWRHVVPGDMLPWRQDVPGVMLPAQPCIDIQKHLQCVPVKAVHFYFYVCVCTYVGVFVTSVAMPHVEQMYTHACIIIII